MPCTTLLVGKNATIDGSTMCARNEDSGSGHFSAKKLVVVEPQDQPRHYKSVISHVEIDLPDNPVRYTAMPNALPDEGIWGECGVNTYNVSMTATETLTTNQMVRAADPFVVYQPAKDGQPGKAGGIGEEDLFTIILPYIRTAREGVIRMGKLLEEYGTYEMNGVGFQDVNEIWWLETIGGHHWIAHRVPDDCYVAAPNWCTLDTLDLDDAFGAQRENMCSADLREWIARYHLDPGRNDDGTFNPRRAFGSHTDADHVYNSPRAWWMERFFNPHSCRWDGPDADYTPECDDMPWAMQPEYKITVEDAKYALSGHYQGTPFDCYEQPQHGPGPMQPELGYNHYRPIGVNRNNFIGLIQMRPYVPKQLQAIEWISYGSNVFNAFVPLYANVDTVPEYFSNTTAKVTTENFYWVNRIIGALADPHFKECMIPIERYQQAVPSLAGAMIHEADEKFMEAHKGENNTGNVPEQLAEVNRKIADMTYEKTQKVLDEVLYNASMKMKNAFSRSDG